MDQRLPMSIHKALPPIIYIDINYIDILYILRKYVGKELGRLDHYVDASIQGLRNALKIPKISDATTSKIVCKIKTNTDAIKIRKKRKWIFIHCMDSLSEIEHEKTLTWDTSIERLGCMAYQHLYVI